MFNSDTERQNKTEFCLFLTTETMLAQNMSISSNVLFAHDILQLIITTNGLSQGQDCKTYGRLRQTMRQWIISFIMFSLVKSLQYV